MSRRLPIGRPVARERAFRTYIITRNRKIPYFKWRRDVYESTYLTAASKQWQRVIYLALIRVALLTSAMRSRLYFYLRNEIYVQLFRRPNKITQVSLRDTKIDELSSGTTPYLKFHTRNHPQFLKQWQYGYKQPTTPNTAPISRKNIIFKLHKAWKKVFLTFLHKRGLLL